MTEGVQRDHTRFLPESDFFPEPHRLSIHSRFGVRRGLGGCVTDPNIVSVRESGPRDLQELPGAAWPVGGAGAGSVF